MEQSEWSVNDLVRYTNSTSNFIGKNKMHKTDKEFNIAINWQELDPPRVMNIAEIKRDNIVLEKYLRIGDTVVMHMDEESRHWDVKGVPDGTIGIVVGFKRYTDYIARVHNFGRMPGVYEGNGVATVRWYDGTNATPGAGNLRWLFDHEKKQVERREDRTVWQAFEYKTFISDLPELPIWEMDIVDLLPNRTRVSNWEGQDLIVSRISWNNYDSKRTDGSPMPIYDCTLVEPGHGHTCYDETEVVLKERGNLWKWFNGQRDQVVFKTLQEEVAFHKSLGYETQIECKQSGNYHWPVSAVLPALKSGEIDYVQHSAGLFGSSAMLAHKMDDENLSARVRAECLAGYDPEKNPVQIRVRSKEWGDEVRKFVITRALEFNVPFISTPINGQYVDRTEFEKLNISVIEYDPQVGEPVPASSYAFFESANEIVNLPHVMNFDANLDEIELKSSLRGRRADKMRVRVQSDQGWNEKNRDILIAAALALDVPFADRANVGDDKCKDAGIKHVALNENNNVGLMDTLDGYVFFTHRGMEDLPFDLTVQGARD